MLNTHSWLHFGNGWDSSLTEYAICLNCSLDSWFQLQPPKGYNPLPEKGPPVEPDVDNPKLRETHIKQREHLQRRSKKVTSPRPLLFIINHYEVYEQNKYIMFQGNFLLHEYQWWWRGVAGFSSLVVPCIVGSDIQGCYWVGPITHHGLLQLFWDPWCIWCQHTGCLIYGCYILSLVTCLNQFITETEI